MAGNVRITQLPFLGGRRAVPEAAEPAGRLLISASDGARRLIPWLLGLVATASAAALMALDLGTPALWRDESATTVAVRRTWPQLWQLFDGSEAPLMPYYTVLKVLTGWTTQIFPGSATHLEVLERWPSAAAVAIACGVLVFWLARISSASVAVCAGALLLLTTGVSRYGQEARPYALVLMLTVLSTVVWWRMVHDRRIRWLLPYALLVAGLVALHALAASLLAAHLAAAVILSRKPGPSRDLSTGPVPIGWLARVLRTALTGAAGVAIASPLTKLAIEHGTGAKTQRPSSRQMLDVFLRLFNGGSAPDQNIIVLLWVLLVALPLVAIVTGWRSARNANLVRLATAWALAPLAVLIPAGIARPNLVASRYLLFVVPGWMLLAGLGLAALAGGWRRAVTAPGWMLPARIASAVIVVVALAGCAVLQQPSLQSVRSTKGHGEDIRVLLDMASQPAYANWPIEVINPVEAVQLSAYMPSWSGRLINARQSTGGSVIWPQKVAGDQVSDRLRSAPGLIFMVRGSTRVRAPRVWTSCRVIAHVVSDRKWSYYILSPTAPPDANGACPSG